MVIGVRQTGQPLMSSPAKPVRHCPVLQCPVLQFQRPHLKNTAEMVVKPGSVQLVVCWLHCSHFAMKHRLRYKSSSPCCILDLLMICDGHSTAPFLHTSGTMSSESSSVSWSMQQKDFLISCCSSISGPGQTNSHTVPHAHYCRHNLHRLFMTGYFPKPPLTTQ